MDPSRKIGEAMNHTPGPWLCQVRPEHFWQSAYLIMAKGDDDPIVVMPAHRPNDEANARLISIAPELYAALDDLVNYLEEEGYTGGRYLTHIVRAAKRVRDSAGDS